MELALLLLSVLVTLKPGVQHPFIVRGEISNKCVFFGKIYPDAPSLMPNGIQRNYTQVNTHVCYKKQLKRMLGNILVGAKKQYLCLEYICQKP